MAKKSSASNTSTQGPSLMAQLLAKHSKAMQTFKKGDLVKGKITKLTKNEITVDINAKTEAVVLEKERDLLNTLLTTLHVGDEVEVSILNPESDSGHPVVSLRRFMGDRAWKVLEQSQKDETPLSVTVTDVTKGGAVVVTESGLNGFLPNSHINSSDQLTHGKRVNVRILELSRKENKLVFSQKSMISASDFEAAAKQLKAGEKIEATITNITPFGMFVTVPVPGKDMTLDGLIHISEVAWEKVDDLGQLFTAGQKMETTVIGFDVNARRVDLSIKRLIADPFDKIVEQYPVDKRVTATITKIDDNGAYFDLGEGVEALIKKDKIPPTVVYKEGQSITATVVEVDRKRHRISLVPVLLEKPLMYR